MTCHGGKSASLNVGSILVSRWATPYDGQSVCTKPGNWTWNLYNLHLCYSCCDLSKCQKGLLLHSSNEALWVLQGCIPIKGSRSQKLRITVMSCFRLTQLQLLLPEQVITICSPNDLLETVNTVNTVDGKSVA